MTTAAPGTWADHLARELIFSVPDEDRHGFTEGFEFAFWLLGVDVDDPAVFHTPCTGGCGKFYPLPEKRSRYVCPKCRVGGR